MTRPILALTRQHQFFVLTILLRPARVFLRLDDTSGQSPDVADMRPPVVFLQQPQQQRRLRAAVPLAMLHDGKERRPIDRHHVGLRKPVEDRSPQRPHLIERHAHDVGRCCLSFRSFRRAGCIVLLRNTIHLRIACRSDFSAVRTLRRNDFRRFLLILQWRSDCTQNLRSSTCRHPLPEQGQRVLGDGNRGPPALATFAECVGVNQDLHAPPRQSRPDGQFVERQSLASVNQAIHQKSL